MNKAKPFLRWAGGKRWLWKHLDQFVDINNYTAYHEPFIGGGSVFFQLNPKEAYISDSNEWLIETYNSIKDISEEVIEHLVKFKNTKEEYYKVRHKKYRNQAKRAAQFIYLNQTSFNGIYRVNLKGKYNVPYGHRYKYNFDYRNINLVSQALINTEINCYDFNESIHRVSENDLVFLDPPYTITHNNNGFIQYNQKIFSLEDQYKLSALVDEIKHQNAYYIVTNAAHQKVREIFTKNGDSVLEINRASLVGGKNAKRGNYSEFLFTNII